MPSQFLADIQSLIADILFPSYCLHCSGEGAYACAKCLHLLVPLSSQACIMCQNPSSDGATHAACATAGSPDGCVSAFDYSSPLVSKLIVIGKYKFIPEIYNLLSRISWPLLSDCAPLTPGSAITFIPLHGARQRWRGFNQAELLAGNWARQTRIPLRQLLARKKSGQVQKNLNRAARLSNTKDIFSPLAAGRSMPGEVWLVDDVVTTGATLLAATQTLKAAGARRVWCLTIARET